MSSPSSSDNEGNDAWLMKIELKREEPMEINKDEAIKKATEDQAPATEDLLRSMCDYPSSTTPPSSPTKKN